LEASSELLHSTERALRGLFSFSSFVSRHPARVATSFGSGSATRSGVANTFGSGSATTATRSGVANSFLLIVIIGFSIVRTGTAVLTSHILTILSVLLRPTVALRSAAVRAALRSAEGVSLIRLNVLAEVNKAGELRECGITDHHGIVHIAHDGLHGFVDTLSALFFLFTVCIGCFAAAAVPIIVVPIVVSIVVPTVVPIVVPAGRSSRATTRVLLRLMQRLMLTRSAANGANQSI
jgi:hypothetical protein